MRSRVFIAAVTLFLFVESKQAQCNEFPDTPSVCVAVAPTVPVPGCLATVAPLQELHLPFLEPEPEIAGSSDRFDWLTVTADLTAKICIGGPIPGQPCQASAQCLGGICQPTAMQQSTFCIGGETPGETCNVHADCPGTCVGGASHGNSCLSDAACAGTCVGGSQSGQTCENSRDCAVCIGGIHAGRGCSAQTDCYGICEGGSRSGLGCAHGGECPGGGCVGPGSCVNPGNCIGAGSCNGNCGLTACSGGANPGQPCAVNADCGPNGQCVPWNDDLETQNLSRLDTGTDGCFEPHCDVGGRIFGSDDRVQIFGTTFYPWRTVGRLTMTFPDGVYTCSGALVGPRIVLTAGHCINKGGGPNRWASAVTFSPGQSGAFRPFGTANAILLVTYRAWVDSRNWAHDMGMVILDRPIGNTTGWMGFSTGGSYNSLLNLAGYPGEKPQTMWWHYGWTSLYFFDNRLIVDKIDTTPGQSGSPVWLFNGVQRYIRAVHSGWFGWNFLGISYTRNRETRITNGKFWDIVAFRNAYPRGEEFFSCALSPCDGVRRSTDCNQNGIDDACDLSCGNLGGLCNVPGCGTGVDANGDQVLDECVGACCLPNGNCQELSGFDCLDTGGVFVNRGTVCPTAACAAAFADCQGNGRADVCDISCGTPGGPCDAPGCGLRPDCDRNAVPDECDIAAGAPDANTNGIPDDCEGVRGACCLPSGKCAVLSQEDCESIPGGVYRGDGSICEGQCEQIPTVGSWGILITALLLLIAEQCVIFRSGARLRKSAA